jgi:hypothetical protein
MSAAKQDKEERALFFFMLSTKVFCELNMIIHYTTAMNLPLLHTT